MHDKENLVREQRLILATTKNLIGLDGKIGQILKYLGEPVVSESSGAYESTELPDVYDLPNEETLPTGDMEGSIREIGRIFSALKFGVNMELSYLKDSLVPVKITEFYTKWVEMERVMTVSYKGYVVYREVEGELDSYLPDPEWETPLDRIYETCKKIKSETKIDKAAEKAEKILADKRGLITRLRDKWGI